MEGVMRPWVAAVGLALLACRCLAQGGGADGTSPFDRPVQTRRVVLGPSPNSPGQQSVVRCATYAGFMVKEIDTAEVGDDQISVLALQSPAERPVCQAANRPGEKIVPTDTWGGYFLGVKAGWLLLSAEDGVNGGMGFAVMRSDEPSRLLFRDLATLDHDRVGFRAVSVEGERLRLRYTRLFAAPCSVQTDRATCWARIVAETHVPPAPVPDCAAGYLRAKRELAAGRCEAQSHGSDAACMSTELAGMADWDTSPSVIGYDVEVVVGPGGPQRTAMGAAGSCWPAD
jgi:hypothetical protein